MNPTNSNNRPANQNIRANVLPRPAATTRARIANFIRRRHTPLPPARFSSGTVNIVNSQVPLDIIEELPDSNPNLTNEQLLSPGSSSDNDSFVSCVEDLDQIDEEVSRSNRDAVVSRIRETLNRNTNLLTDAVVDCQANINLHNERDRARYTSHNQTLSAVNIMADWFSKLKPVSISLLLRSIILDSLPIKLASVFALFEQANLVYDYTKIVNFMPHIINFFRMLSSGFTKLADRILPQASFRDDLERLLGIRLPDVPESILNVFSSVIGFIVLCTGGLITFFSHSRGSFSSFLKGFSEMGKTVGATASSLGIFKDLLRRVVQSCGFSMKHESELQEAVDSMKTHAERMTLITDEVKTNPFKLYDGTYDAMALINRSIEEEKFFTNMNKEGKLISELETYKRLTTTRLTLQRSLKALDSALGVKQRPAVLWFWGDPGRGKSTAIPLIVNELSRLEGKPLTVYDRTIVDQYFSGYAQQDVVVYDDFSVSGDKDDDALELMQCVSTSSQPLNMASLEEKGRLFKSRYIIVCSNYDIPRANAMNFQALARRRDFAYRFENVKIDQYLKDASNHLEDFNDFEGFTEGFRMAQFVYTKDDKGNVSENSQIKLVGKPLGGLSGLRELAKRMYTKQEGYRAQLIASVKDSIRVASDLATDNVYAPGVDMPEDGSAEFDGSRASSARGSGSATDSSGFDIDQVNLDLKKTRATVYRRKRGKRSMDDRSFDDLYNDGTDDGEFDLGLQQFMRGIDETDMIQRSDSGRFVTPMPTPRPAAPTFNKIIKPHADNGVNAPCVFIFFGDSGVGKSFLAKSILNDADKEVEHLEDPFDDPDNFQKISTAIREYGDAGFPCIITANTSRLEAFHKWLKNQDAEGEDELVRFQRRCKYFIFKAKKQGILKQVRYTPDELKGSYENLIRIHSWNPYKRSTIEEFSRNSIRDAFFDRMKEVVEFRFLSRAFYAERPENTYHVNFSSISIHSRPTQSDFFNACLNSISLYASYRTQVNLLLQNLGSVTFDNITLEGICRQLNQAHVPFEADKIFRVSFKEGELIVASIGGFLHSFVIAEWHPAVRDGRWVFLDQEGFIKQEMTQEEKDFYCLATGTELSNVDLGTDHDITAPEITDFTKVLSKMEAAYTAITSLISGAFVGLVMAETIQEVRKRREQDRNPLLPEGRQRNRANRDDFYNERIDFDARERYETEEVNAWADDYEDEYGNDLPEINTAWEYEEQVANSMRRQPRSRRYVRNDKDASESSGRRTATTTRPAYMESRPQDVHRTQVSQILRESTYDRKPDPMLHKVTVESSDLVTKPLRPRIVIEKYEASSESNVQISKPAKPKIAVEKDYSSLLRSDARADGTKLFKDLCRLEGHHLTSKPDLWCPVYLNKKGAKGGSQTAHHHCKKCGRYALKLWNYSDPNTRCCYACKGYDMPELYFHSGCDVCGIKIPIKKEGCIDESFLPVYKKILANSIKFRGFYGLMIRNHYGVAPNHCFSEDKMRTETGDVAEVISRLVHKDQCIFMLVNKQARQYADISHFLLHRGDYIEAKQPCMLAKDPVGMNIALPVLVEVSGVFNVDGLGQKSLTQCRLFGGGVFTTYATEKGDCGAPLVRISSHSTKKLIGIHVAASSTEGYVSLLCYEDFNSIVAQGLDDDDYIDDLVLCNKELFFDLETPNWCTQLSPAPNRHLCSQCHQYVLQVIGGMRTVCYQCQGLAVPPFFVHKKRDCQYCRSKLPEKQEAEYLALPTHQIRPLEGKVGKTFLLMGETLSPKGVKVRNNTRGLTHLRESPLRTDRFGEIYEPAIMSVDDPRNPDHINPYIQNVDKWDIPRGVQDPAELKQEFREMGEYFATIIKNAQLPISKLTIEEAINRDTRHENSNPIYLHTSAGFPYNTYPNVRCKLPMIFFDEPKNRYRIDKDRYEGWLLIRHIETLVKNCAKGKKTAVIFDVNLKDEALPHRKIESVGTRSIVASPLDYSIGHRMFCHTALAALMETRREHPIKIGIAPNTLEFHALYRYLVIHTKKGFDADWKWWDAHCLPDEIQNQSTFYNTIYEYNDPDWTEQDDLVRDTLYAILARPLITRDGDVVQSQGGIVSGEPGTGHDNSVINLRRLWHAFKLLVDEKKWPEHMKTFYYYVENQRTAVNGDDHIVMPHPSTPEFNFEYCKKHFEATYFNQYTPGDKTSTKSDRPIYEMTFLKRKFLKLPEFGGYVVGGLMDQAFSKMTSCTRVNKAAPYRKVVDWVPDAFEQTFETYLLESALCGKEFYHKTVNHIREVCSKYSMRLPFFESWKSAFSRVYFAREVPVAYF